MGIVLSPLRAVAGTRTDVETRVRGIELVVHAFVGGSSARSPEKHLGSSLAYDEIAPGYSLGAEETTTKYRTVSQAEMEDIAATGGFRGGDDSMGNKWFAESAEDAAACMREEVLQLRQGAHLHRARPSSELGGEPDDARSDARRDRARSFGVGRRTRLGQRPRRNRRPRGERGSKEERMNTRRQYALIDLRWMPLPAFLTYPGTRGFGLTGYSEADGAGGIFSVYVKTLDGEPGSGKTQSAKLYALVEDLRSCLPEIGEKFLLSTGTTVVAECVTRDRGEEEPEP